MKNDGDVWVSGKVNVTQSIHIKYVGKELQSGKEYFWKVKSFTNKGEAWSEPASWSMGLLKKSDWKGKWIGYDKASPWDSITQWSRLSARYFRKEFQNSSAVKRAIVYISGLGLYELYVNGHRIGDQVLAPHPTDYRKSFFYNTHDVTAQIRNGNNAIATVLGNGRFFTMHHKSTCLRNHLLLGCRENQSLLHIGIHDIQMRAPNFQFHYLLMCRYL